MPFLQKVRRIKMSQKEQEIIKRQLNYYLDKNIVTLKKKFYGEDGIWSKYQAFTERFKLNDSEVYCIKNLKNHTIVRLDLDTYCLGKGDKNPEHNDNGYGTFSWWVEFYLKDLGAVGGSSSAVHGIYYSPKSKCYRNGKNEGISQEICSEQTEKTSSNNNAQSYFTEGTYHFIKFTLGIENNNNEIDQLYSNCKPNNVVLNKIYYLFNMEKSDTKLIPIFKEESLNSVLEQLDVQSCTKKDANDQKNTDGSSQSDIWQSKSAKVYVKFEEFLKDRSKDEVEVLFKVPSEQERQNNANHVEIKDDNLIKKAQNLFKSYCFGCFFWSTFENQGGLSNKIDGLISRGDKNIILTGAPGTGKTFACKNYAREQVGNFISDIPENLEKRKNVSELLKNVSEVLKTVDGCNQSSSPSPDYFIKTVQFHPGYDYSDFIEGLRPKKVGDSNTIIYDRKDGIFKEFCKKVVLFNKQVAEFNKTGNNEKIPLDSSKFFFIIDEINRGEVSKIFGEAFSMIETDKRAPVDSNSEDVTNKVDTQYSSLIENKDDPFQHGFYIPENVYILATMNEIDRSLEAMDFAFRRRFSWLTVEVQDTLNEIIVNSVLDDCTYSVSSHMSEIEYSFNELNELIKNNLGPDYMLGGSYLTSLKNSSKTSVKTLKEELWNNHLEPIIKDYIKGTEDNIEVYRSKFVDSNVGSINDDSKKEPLNVKQ